MTTDWVAVLLTILFPKLNELPLKAALVESGDAAALTVTDAVTLWLSEPEVPWSEMLAFPAAAVGVAVTLICCRPPGIMERVIGVAVTPLGKEPTATFTLPVKPFDGEAVTATVCAGAPGVIVSVEGAIARVKSPEPVVALLDDPPPPHPVKTVRVKIAHKKGIRDCMRGPPSVSVK